MYFEAAVVGGLTCRYLAGLSFFGAHAGRASPRTGHRAALARARIWQAGTVAKRNGRTSPLLVLGFQSCHNTFIVSCTYSHSVLYTAEVVDQRYSSCRYNERQLIDITVVRRVRPRAERWCDYEGTAGGREPVGLFFAIDLVVHLLLNGTSLVTRDGAEDAHVLVPYPRALC